jgi:hypothetical protein
MKRTLLTCITALMAFPLFAQNGYEGAGFYRIQNQGEAGRYVSIENDKVSEESKKISFAGGKSVSANIEALKTVKSKDSNPGTVIYVSGSTSGLTLEAQGMNTDELLAKFGYSGYKLKMSGQGELNTSYEGYQIDLIDFGYDYPVKKDAFCAVATLNFIRTNTINKYALWNFKKIDNVNEFFGVNPNEGITDGKKYYTTLFTSFAYQLSEGMKAYYIGRHFYDTNHVEEPIAELLEITGGKIPAATPVIIECSSSNVADNKVTLLNEDLTPISGNPLKGRVFCFIPGQYEDQNMKNALEFNKKTMCVLGMKDITRGDRGETTGAKLVLVTESNNDYNISSSLTNGYIPANKAYLPLNNISSSEADAIAKKGIRLLLPADYDVATSISKVVSEDKVVKEGIYTLTGVKVKDTNSTENLPSGIYIINGKKQVIR